MAVSATAIEESTFIWNPNLVALSSAIAFAAAWRAWTTGRARWWIVAAAGQAVTMHCHVLGAVLLAPLAAFLIADARRRVTGPARRQVLLAGAAALGVIVASYVPLLVSELQSNFGETRAVAHFVLNDSDDDAGPLPLRIVIVWLRVLSWPLSGLITAQPVAAVLVAVAVVTILAWRIRAAAEPERRAAASAAVILAWSATTVAVLSSSLAHVVPGLPNDHYHAFIDPLVFVVAGLGVAALWRLNGAGRIVATAGIAALVVLNVAIWPPRVAPDGGYPLAERAAARIIQVIGGDPYRLEGLPTAKRPDAYEFPLVRFGRPPGLWIVGSELPIVIACDRLLEPMIGASCGGPAEDARVLQMDARRTLVERFDASTRTVISIYR